jgi:ABC-type transport system involved in Fe-S cluster assembly fused permease/ATPase subunit
LLNLSLSIFFSERICSREVTLFMYLHRLVSKKNMCFLVLDQHSGSLSMSPAQHYFIYLLICYIVIESLPHTISLYVCVHLFLYVYSCMYKCITIYYVISIYVYYYMYIHTCAFSQLFWARYISPPILLQQTTGIHESG